jgi:hypothetical protein
MFECEFRSRSTFGYDFCIAESERRRTLAPNAGCLEKTCSLMFWCCGEVCFLYEEGLGSRGRWGLY